MEKFSTIYDECCNILTGVMEEISAVNGLNFDANSIELLNFLCTDCTQYGFFYECDDDYQKNKKLYKRIMMLIIVDNCYLLSFYNTNKKIDEFENEQIFKSLEDKNFFDFIAEFLHWEENPQVFSYIENYCNYLDKNYIYQNNCLQMIIEEDKINSLLQINPFAFLNFTNYIDPDSIIITEKIIQDFIDLYDSSLYEQEIDEFGESEFYESDEEHIKALFDEKIKDNFGYEQEKIKKFYSYVFSNVYESVSINIKIDSKALKDYKLLIEAFKNNTITFEEIYYLYMNDLDFAFQLIDYFLRINDYLYDGDLFERREAFKNCGNVKVLKRLNPYYEQEEIVFDQIKKMEQF